jgi:hypothetical protein
MVDPEHIDARLAELADGALDGPEWDAWLAEHPAAADQVRRARQVRELVRELRSADYAVPAGFEARVLERIREDATLRDMLDLGVNGVGRLLLELLALLLGLLPNAAPSAEPITS